MINRIDVGTPSDDQERAGLILSRATRWIMHIRDQYMMRAPDPTNVPKIFDALIELVDIAEQFMTSTTERLEHAYGTKGLKGFAFFDYRSLLAELYRRCGHEAQAMSAWSERAEHDEWLMEELRRLPADLDHHQLQFERAGYHMDIVLASQDKDNPDFSVDEPMVEDGGGAVDPEPLKWVRGNGIRAKPSSEAIKPKRSRKNKNRKNRRRGK